MEKLETYIKLPDSLMTGNTPPADPVVVFIWVALFFCGAIALALILVGEREL